MIYHPTAFSISNVSMKFILAQKVPRRPWDASRTSSQQDWSQILVQKTLAWYHTSHEAGSVPGISLITKTTTNYKLRGARTHTLKEHTIILISVRSIMKKNPIMYDHIRILFIVFCFYTHLSSCGSVWRHDWEKNVNVLLCHVFSNQSSL